MPQQPTEQEVQELKKKYGRIFRVALGDDVFLVKPLDRKTHLDIQKKVFPGGMPTNQETVSPEDNGKVEEETIKAAVVWPTDQNAIIAKAGTIPLLFPQILYVSGFVPLQEPVEL